MSPSSMTGFASVSRQIGDISLRFDIKSVNGKGLEIRAKVPTDYDGLDLAIKKLISDKIARGTVQATLSVDRAGNQSASLAVDEAILSHLIETAKKLSDTQAISVETLMGLPGVLTSVGLPAMTDDIRRVIQDMVGTATDGLKDSRAEEGASISAVLMSTVADMRTLLARAKDTASQRPEAIADRYEALLARVTGLKDGPDADRLAQEVAMLAVRIDVTEELDRLETHFDAIEEGLKQSGPIGRRFDFLAQELVREANTLCSKSQDKDLTAIGIQLKSLIDQFREQALNIE